MTARTTEQAAIDQETAIANVIDKYTINGCTPINATELVEHSLKTNNGHNPNNNSQFQPGNKLGGRRGGAKNKITAQFIDDLTHEWHNRGAQCLSELSAKELVGTAVAILPKDVLVSMNQSDQVQWVINAQPMLSTDDWLANHNLLSNQHDTDIIE